MSYIPTPEEAAELEIRDYTPKFKVGEKLWHPFIWGDLLAPAEIEYWEIVEHKIIRSFGDPRRGVIYLAHKLDENGNRIQPKANISEVQHWIHQHSLYRTANEARNHKL